jgi:nucleotide-binding universal stress UspA family protein
VDEHLGGRGGDVTTGHVVVGVDGSAASLAALRWAAAATAPTGAPVRAVTVWAPAPAIAAGPTVGGAAAMTTGALVPGWPDAEMQRTDAEQRLREAVADLPGGPQVQLRVVPGDAADVLLEESRGASLLVLGNGRRGALAGALAGSVALRCAHHAECPVVLVPAPAERGGGAA